MGKLVDEMDELSEKIFPLNISVDDLNIIANKEFSFLSDSDSYDLSYEIVMVL